ncbi:SLATT domain-containing protein [Piscibacillus sp. B03]
MKELAENGYNVIYGARKHFSTYDIVSKIPGRIAYLALIIGVWQIYMPDFYFNKEVSLILIFSSITAIIINQYNGEKERYKETGNRLIQLHNGLREIYYQVQSSEEKEIEKELCKMKELMDEYYQISISKQIFFSDWLAHYKLFFQSQYEWINEQKNFTWRDKVPMSFRIFVILFAVVALGSIIIFFINGWGVFDVSK